MKAAFIQLRAQRGLGMQSGKGMKVLLVVYGVLAFLPLAVTLIAWSSFPDTIAVHFTMDGQADGWGQRIEAIWFPLAIVGFSILMMVVAWMGATETSNPERNVLYATSLLIITLIFGNVICARAIFYNIPSLSKVTIGAGAPQLAPLLCGIILLGGGIASRFIGQNSYSGSRVPWRLSEASWLQLQRVSGSFAVAFGAVLLVVSFLNIGGSTALSAAVVVSAAECALILVYGFVLSKRERR